MLHPLCHRLFLPAARSAAILVALLLLVPVARGDAPPLVVSSIRPLQLIVLAVAGEAVQARTLPAVRGTAHDFVLRPSDLRLLRAADRVFWIGPQMERPLGAMLARLPDPAKAIALLPASGVETGVGDDPHVWLDPRAAVAMARHISASLAGTGRVDQPRLAARLAAFEREMQATEAAMRAELDPIRARPFFVMHDGYSHFVRRFGLDQAAALALDEEHRPGARTLSELRAKLVAAGPVCLLTEPGVHLELLDTLTQGTAARVQAMDPLAFDVAESPTAYAAFLRDFAHRLATCLQDARNGDKPHE